MLKILANLEHAACFKVYSDSSVDIDGLKTMLSQAVASFGTLC